MSQHISSMLEHFKLSNLKKNRLQENDKMSVNSNHNSNNSINNNNTNTNNNNNHHSNSNHIHTNHTNSIGATTTTTSTHNLTTIAASVNSTSDHVASSLIENDKNGKIVVANSLDTKMSRLKENGEFEVQPKGPTVKPKKVKNIATKAETYDTTHSKAIDVMHCRKDVCMGSVMFPNVMGAEPRKPEVILEHARDFLDQYYTSIRRLKSTAHATRLDQIEKEVAATGTYNLTETELIFGAKLAWRNASRCIGRIQWSKLQVFDCRFVTTTSGMFEAICNHIKYATNKGNLRSAITIFSQRTDGKHDYRIWNSQLISYAGYKNADGTFTGDGQNTEFTEFCQKIGWKSKRTDWDILPIVVSANGHDPDYFDYPPDLILQVPLHHPSYKWFDDFDLRWYAVPAVSGMMFDCGGIQFCGSAFSGWYMSTEIGCRNLCDAHRRNILEPVALKMGLDTRNPTSLWKDKALVEINVAVLHSFQIANITIVDHHTASESFMKHFENETKSRHGCPADWIWIVPPMSASITPVYHQEMALYYLRPSFEYQESPVKTHVWKKGRDPKGAKKTNRKFHFKQIARAVKFTSKLFGRALSRRIKATVLYATETGKSENYAKILCELLGHAFNAQVYCMTDYDISSIEHEALLIVVASTFGNGDPPENGESFAQDLYGMKLQQSGQLVTNDLRDLERFPIEPAKPKSLEQKPSADSSGKAKAAPAPAPAPVTNGDSGVKVKIGHFNADGAQTVTKADKFQSILSFWSASVTSSSKSFIKANSRSDLGRTNANDGKKIDRLDSLRGSVADSLQEESFGPLSNVRFAVFALGSSAYPNFCSYGKYIDNLLGELGGERLLKLETADEMCGQEQTFRKWAPEAFKLACETFCLDTDDTLAKSSFSMNSDTLTESTLRFSPADSKPLLVDSLGKYHNKKIKNCYIKRKPISLHSEQNSTERSTILVEILADGVDYQPGDHVGILPSNRKEIVEGILSRLRGIAVNDDLLQLEVLKEKQTANGVNKTWELHEKLPPGPMRMYFSRFLDITTPPTRQLLTFLASCCDEKQDEERLTTLANNPTIYEDWKHSKYPHLLEVLQEFPSCKPPATVLVALLPPLQPRFYSISSAPRKHRDEIHLTVAVVKYRTEDGRGSEHFGVCSNYLEELDVRDDVYLFVRSAASFHMPTNKDVPVIMIGPGTGIAPFRSFWQDWEVTKQDYPNTVLPKIWLFFGCRTNKVDIYREEKAELVQKGILDKVFLALSRETGVPKTYVQDLANKEAESIYDLIVNQGGHIYVCGDVTMAEHVYQTLRKIIARIEKKSEAIAEKFMLKLRDENRYHEDIFGITLRTAEITTKSRMSAKIRMSGIIE